VSKLERRGEKEKARKTRRKRIREKKMLLMSRNR
jgi:hypothetical protein